MALPVSFSIITRTHLSRRLPRRQLTPAIALALSVVGGLASAADLKLSGTNEVPPVKTTATGSGSVTVYVNVHSDAHKDGEVRAQVKP